MPWIRQASRHCCELPFSEIEEAKAGDVWECDWCSAQYTVSYDVRMDLFFRQTREAKPEDWS